MNQYQTLGLLSAILLSSCSQYPLNTSLRVGEDRDRFGCVVSAGYQWCGAKQSCVRPWELAKAQGLSLEDQSVKHYCAGQANP